MSTEEKESLFLNFGYDAKFVKETLANAKLSTSLYAVLKESGLSDCGNKDTANALREIASKKVTIKDEQKSLLISYAATQKISSKEQLEAAYKYFKDEKDINDTESFDKSCGVGVVITKEILCTYVEGFMESSVALFTEYNANYRHPNIMNALREGCPFGGGELIKIYMATAPAYVAGLNIPVAPVEQTSKKPAKKGKGGKADAKDEKMTEEKKGDVEFLSADELNQTYKIENLDAQALTAEQQNTEALNKKHLEFFGGKILTRFPPEPNGFLHIGHCKSIRFNFSLAGVNGGETYLRYDDTNPAAEDKRFMDGIKDSVEWLGYAPWKVTHSSEYFDELYGFALKLIQKGKAFVCFQTKEESKATREAEQPSPFRDTSVEENLKQFELMRIGSYDAGQAVLRAKIDYKSDNTTLRDPPIYRIAYTAHPHIGDKWCIYPLYDFTHGICDSLENITHSCCTKEFEIRRDLYYWFLVELDLYRPYVYEFARLNMTYTFLSKRKVDKLTKLGVICGWDDPRLYTVLGMRRRGVTREAINYFCDCLSVTRTNSDTTIQVEYFENVVRRDLNENCRRTLAVLDPVKLIIEDMSAEETIELEAPVYPNKKDSKEMYKVNLSKVVYMDRSDVRDADSKDFYGVCPGKTVRLKYGPCVKVNFGDFKKDADGKVVEMTCQRLPAEQEAKSKPKGVLGWISEKDAFRCEVRNFEHLFTTPFPDKDKWLDQINENSKKVFEGAMMNKGLVEGLKVLDKFQFERVGFYTVDSDTDVAAGKIVLNLTVTLAGAKKKIA